MPGLHPGHLTSALRHQVFAGLLAERLEALYEYFLGFAEHQELVNLSITNSSELYFLQAHAKRELLHNGLLKRMLIVARAPQACLIKAYHAKGRAK